MDVASKSAESISSLYISHSVVPNTSLCVSCSTVGSSSSLVTEYHQHFEDYILVQESISYYLKVALLVPHSKTVVNFMKLIYSAKRTLAVTFVINVNGMYERSSPVIV